MAIQQKKSAEKQYWEHDNSSINYILLIYNLELQLINEEWRKTTRREVNLFSNNYEIFLLLSLRLKLKTNLKE